MNLNNRSLFQQNWNFIIFNINQIWMKKYWKNHNLIAEIIQATLPGEKSINSKKSRQKTWTQTQKAHQQITQHTSSTSFYTQDTPRRTTWKTARTFLTLYPFRRIRHVRSRHILHPANIAVSDDILQDDGMSP